MSGVWCWEEIQGGLSNVVVKKNHLSFLSKGRTKRECERHLCSDLVSFQTLAYCVSRDLSQLTTGWSADICKQTQRPTSKTL